MKVIPTAPAPRVRPLWERHELFREPHYDNSLAWRDEYDDEDNTEPEPTA